MYQKETVSLRTRKIQKPDLEDVKGCMRVQTRLLIKSAQVGRFCALVGRKGGLEVDFETFGNEVVEFDLVVENIGGGPRLGQGESVDFVRELSLDVAMDNVCLGVTRSLDLERNVGRSLCLNFKLCPTEWVVLGE